MVTATDLIPGSSANARTAAEAWKKRSEAAVALRDHLAKLDDDGAWSGDAYDLYQERFERQLLHWKKTGTSLMDGASALYTWADALDWARDEADRAITLWNEAERDSAAALVQHKEYLRSLRIGQGLRHPEAEVPFVDPAAGKYGEARTVLFDARATLEVFARDCAQKLDAARAEAEMPLTDAEAGDQQQDAIVNALFTVGVILPFEATMGALSVAAQTLWENPDIILELLGGVASFIGGSAMIIGGGAVVVGTGGIAALLGAPALIAAGVGVAGLGAGLTSDATGRWLNESHGVADRQRGVDRGDGRDYGGTFANGQEHKPWVDKEKIGLDKVEEDLGVDVVRDKIKVDFPNSPQDGRKYDGFIENPDGTYTGVEITSGSAINEYNRGTSTQRQFDDAVRAGTPAHGKLNGTDVTVTDVITREVP